MDSLLSKLDPLIAALRPHLQPLTANLPTPVRDTGLSLLGAPCYKNLVIDIAPTAECTSLAISKALGTGIVAASAVVKVPQLLKLLSSKSAAGLSFPSYLLETASFGISLAYGARNGFPFSTYGESALIGVQNVVIAALILHLSGRSAGAAAFVAGVAGTGYALASPELVDMEMLTRLMAAGGALAVASKIPQIWTIWQEGGTGQLSAFAVFNYLVGSLSRIYTTLQEVPDRLVLYTFVAGFAFNLILATQMLYYWNSPTSAPHAREIGKKPERIAMRESSATATGAKTQLKVKSPTTRRRA